MDSTLYIDNDINTSSHAFEYVCMQNLNSPIQKLGKKRSYF